MSETSEPHLQQGALDEQLARPSKLYKKSSTDSVLHDGDRFLPVGPLFGADPFQYIQAEPYALSESWPSAPEQNKPTDGEPEYYVWYCQSCKDGPYLSWQPACQSCGEHR